MFFKLFSFVIVALMLSHVGKAEDLQPAKGKTKDVADLDMADLLKVKVTSVSKKAQALSDAPSAVFVISNDDIRRSGVTNIPDALRMAPGIDVARVGSSKWAITSRGFNGNYANKLLVLIDGRTVYTPAFSGVYWDAQDTLLEDIDRIEVIRGPGATLWGSNAVNGVINIITKRAEDTQGGLLTGGGGTRETGFGSFRYAQKLGEDTYARAYVKGFVRDNFKTPDGKENGGDNWDRVQGGFRIDSRLTDQDELTVQGDLYHTNFNQILALPNDRFVNPFTDDISSLQRDSAHNSGWNVLSRLNHKFSSTSEYTLQFYYDRTHRNEDYIEQSLDTLDVDFQHNFELTESQNMIWGLGYRANLDKFSNSKYAQVVPEERNTQLFSAFLQDEITLIDDTLWLSLGTKFEHNDYTGFEGQPSARLLWAPSTKQRFWAAFSRSVRTPARSEHNVHIHRNVLPSPISPLPLDITINGNPNYAAEVQLAYELGYRFSFSEKASLDFTAFFNDYDKLRGINPGSPPTVPNTFPPGFIPVANYFNNASKAKTYGFEISSIWQMNDWWRWEGSYSFLQTKIHDPFDAAGQPVSPQHKFTIRAIVNPADNIDLDLWLRYNDAAVAQTAPTLVNPSSVTPIKGYVTLDARMAWRPIQNLEFSLVGQNLLADKHLEYRDEVYAIPVQVPRAVYGKVGFEF